MSSKGRTLTAAVEKIEALPVATFEQWQAYLDTRRKAPTQAISINYSFEYEGNIVNLYGRRLQSSNDNTWFIADVEVGNHVYQVKILADGKCRLTNRRGGKFAGGRSRGNVPFSNR